MVAFTEAVMALVRRDGAGLTMREAAVLVAVAERATRPTIRHLAAHLRVSKPVVTRAADSLSKAGLLTRVPDERDRRSVDLALTKDGVALAHSLGCSL